MTTSPDRRYDELIERCKVVDQGSFWEATNLHQSRPRFVKLRAIMERHLTGRRDTILDLGCGHGKFLYLCADLGFRRIVGVDFFARLEETYLNDVEGAEILQLDFNEERFLKDFEDGSVDCLVSTETFEHLLNHPLGYLMEGWRTLRPGGLLVFTVPNPANLANAVRLLMGKSYQWGMVEFAKTPKIAPDGSMAAMWDIHFMEYPQGEIIEILRELPGAEVVEKGFIGANPSPYESTARRLMKKALQVTGLRDRRLISKTQYFIVRKQG